MLNSYQIIQHTTKQGGDTILIQHLLNEFMNKQIKRTSSMLHILCSLSYFTIYRNQGGFQFPLIGNWLYFKWILKWKETTIWTLTCTLTHSYYGLLCEPQYHCLPFINKTCSSGWTCGCPAEDNVSPSPTAATCAHQQVLFFLGSRADRERTTFNEDHIAREDDLLVPAEVGKLL